MVLGGGSSVGNQSGSAKARLWYFGVALAVGLVATLLSLARVQRSVSRAQAADDGQASQGPDSAVARRSGQVSPGAAFVWPPPSGRMGCAPSWLDSRCDGGWRLVLVGWHPRVQLYQP